MSRATRVLLIALLVGVCFFLPSKSHALERDPYLIRTLVARIQLEYDKTTIEEGGRTSRDDSHFKQIYSLDTRGYIVTRYLLIYDAGVSFSDDAYDSTSSDFDTKEYYYNLRTTFLPKSAIPLTLYGRYNNSTVSGQDMPLRHSRLTYGLNWFANIRPLPKTFFMLERTNDKSDTSDRLTTYSRVRAEKDLGPTENEIEYTYQNSDDQNSSAFTKSSDVNFRNRTHLSKHTTMSIGATLSESENKLDSPTAEQPPRVTLEGLSLALSSRPSQEFDQIHTYTFYRNKSDGTTTGSVYSGDLDYSFSDRLKSHLGLTYSENKNETSTSEFKNQTISTSDNITYVLTRYLSISEIISYSKNTTNAGPDTATNVGGRSSLRLTTTVSYWQPLSFARFISNYSISYLDDSLTQEPPARGGKGIEQNLYVGLSDINLVPHVSISTSANYITIKNLSGDVSGRGYGYDANVYNKSLRKYFQITGTYSKKVSAPWIDILEERRELYRLSASSTYFRNTDIRANAEHVNAFNNIIGFSSTANQDLSISHKRRLLGGSLFLTASFSHLTAHSSGEPQEIFRNIYEGKYSRPFFRTLLWQIRMSRNEKDERRTFENISLVENAIFMPLRSWLFSLEHIYTLTEDPLRERTENRLILKASRSFLRVY